MTRFTLWGLYQYDPTLFDTILLPSEIDKELLIDDIMEKSGDLHLYYQVPHRAKHQIESWFARNYMNFKKMIEALLADYNPIENYDMYTDETTTDNRDMTVQSSGSDSVQLSGSDGTTRDVTTNNTLSGSDVDTLSGSDVNTAGGTDKNVLSGQDKTERDGDNNTEVTVSAFDSGVYSPHDNTSVDIDETDTTTYGKTSTDTYGRTDTTAYGKKDTMTYGKIDDGSIDEDITVTYGKKDTTTYGKLDTTNDDDIVHHVDHTHGRKDAIAQDMIQKELELRKFSIYDYIAKLFEHDLLVQLY